MDQDTLFDQLTTMTKAYSFDAIKDDYEKVKEENKLLKERVKQLTDLINEYTTKMLNNLNSK